MEKTTCDSSPCQTHCFFILTHLQTFSVIWLRRCGLSRGNTTGAIPPVAWQPRAWQVCWERKENMEESEYKVCYKWRRASVLSVTKAWLLKQQSLYNNFKQLFFVDYPGWLPLIIACKQALHCGESREVTQERHARLFLRPLRHRRSLARSLAACFARHNWRACLQANLIMTTIPLLPSPCNSSGIACPWRHTFYDQARWNLVVLL